jgi:hypothetical protein
VLILTPSVECPIHAINHITARTNASQNSHEHTNVYTSYLYNSPKRTRAVDCTGLVDIPQRHMRSAVTPDGIFSHVTLHLVQAICVYFLLVVFCSPLTEFHVASTKEWFVTQQEIKVSNRIGASKKRNVRNHDRKFMKCIMCNLRT